MRSRPTLLCAAILAAHACAAHAQTTDAGTVTVNGGRPTTLPAQIPATIEGVTGAQVEQRINATDSEDALKYLPSLLVRKRYIGDYNHAVLSTRASGTGNSARSMVYADGILLSNYLGNGAGFTPRWAMVTPEEIERVDVLYGPFSAAYAGNAAGAVVDYVTRMPAKFTAHVKLGAATQRFRLYSTDERDTGRQGSLSVGDRNGALAWWFNVNRLDSRGQPLVIATRLLAEGVAPAAGTPAVTGAIADRNNRNQDWWILGTHTGYRTVQDHAKLKLAYDLTPTLRASYTYGVWDNTSDGNADSYLRDAQGRPVYGGNVVIAGRQYNLNAPSLAFTPTRNTLRHSMHGLTLKSNTRGEWDGELTASLYDYGSDRLRTPSTASGAGRITDMDGTGWNTLHARGIWRPAGAHMVEFGAQREAYRLRTLVRNTADWLHSEPGARFSSFGGNTRLTSIYLQDTWRFAADWKATLGWREENWRAWGGELGNAAAVLPFGASRSETHGSPKAALSWRADEAWTVKASLGRAWRMPTVSELYQGSLSGDTIVNTDPNLRAERSWTGELSAERAVGGALLRATVFHERTRDALYSQALTATVNTVQNVDAIRTRGLELAWQQPVLRTLDLQGSVTYTDSAITANAGFPASVGKQQPRVPRWRAALLATWQPTARLSWTVGARYSGTQYGQLDNSDTHGASYLGFSPFTVIDTRVRYKLDGGWSVAGGIDNLGDRTYWAFHPYPQRTLMLELRWDK